MYDVIIVGSGPAGWTAAIYTARAGMKPLVLAGTADAGGALMQTTEVENFPGFPEGILGPDLMDKLEQQATRFGAEMRYEDVTEMHLDQPVKEVTTESDTYQTRSVILALGSEYKKLGVDREAELVGKGVSYCATCDGFFFRDKEVAVVGGGDSAVTEAEFLTRFASKVHLIHRRDQLRATQIMADRVAANSKIHVHWNSVVDTLHGQSKLESLTLRDTVTGDLSELPVSGLFVAIGHQPRSAVAGDAVETDDHGYIVVDEPSTRTRCPGVFACGDVVDHHYQQAITAAGMGCKAALDAEEYVSTLAAQ